MNEKRLIDANELSARVRMNPSTLSRTEVLDMINATPTERKTGKWEIYVISMLDGEGCKCSECGFEGAPYWHFCPFCGAKMEVDE